MIVQNPYVSLVLLLAMFAMHFIWLVGKQLNNDTYKPLYYLKLLVLVCFVALEVTMLVCYSKY